MVIAAKVFVYTSLGNRVKAADNSVKSKPMTLWELLVYYIIKL